MPHDIADFSPIYRLRDLPPCYHKPMSVAERQRLGIVRIRDGEVEFQPGSRPLREAHVDATEEEIAAALAGIAESDGDGVNRTSDLSSNLRMRLSTLPRLKEDPSTVDYGVMLSLFEEGLDAPDVRTTFAASPRGEHARQRDTHKNNFENYLERSVTKAEEEFRANGHAELEHVEVVKPNGKAGAAEDDVIEAAEPEGLSMLRGVDVKPISPKFFIRPYLPDGSLSILFGDPGTSKTLLAMWMMARISRGESIFDVPTRAANVMMLSNEDDPGILMGRYSASSGDAERITFENFTGETFALESIDKLRVTVKQYRPKVVVIDSVMSHIGSNADVYRQNEVAAVLSPLQAMAQQFKIVVIGLMHMNKQEARRVIYRIGGSIGFAGSARSAMFLDFKPDDQHRRILCHVKANYSVRGSSQELSIRDTADHIGRVEWIGRSEITADDLLVNPDADSGGHKLRQAKDFLKDVLVNGPLPANEIYAAAEGAQISAKTLERAKKSLGIESRRSKDNSCSIWHEREAKKK